MLFGYLSLVNPMWLWALPVAVAVPLFAHLLSSRGGQVVRFPATRFVQMAAANHAKWLRPRHWLLLLLRCAFLSLIALAFTGPVWYHAGPPAPGGCGHGAGLGSFCFDEPALSWRDAV